jgi:rhodanese-related sulfurtransferase
MNYFKSFSKKNRLVLFAFIFLSAFTIPGNAQIFEDLTSIQGDSLINANVNNPDFVILDVRTPNEYNPEHLDGAINRDYYDSDFSDQLDALLKHKTYLIHCKSGGRSGVTLDLMQALGFVEVYDMLGGMNSWNSQSLPTTDLFGPKLMFVSDTIIPLQTIELGETDTIEITLTNRANSILTFGAVSSLADTEFDSNFDPEVSIFGAYDYTFEIYYTPTDESPDTLLFYLESNGGNAYATIYRSGEDNTLSVFETNSKLDIRLFPNPTSEILFLDDLNSKTGILDIVNQNGQIVYRELLSNINSQVDISGFPKGIYYVKINTGEQEVSKPFIVK